MVTDQTAVKPTKWEFAIRSSQMLKIAFEADLSDWREVSYQAPLDKIGNQRRIQ
jgi:hypothetical protein